VTTRLFVAIWPSAAAGQALAHTVDAARRVAPDVRWQPPERWHITLAFLGAADPTKAGARIDALARADRLPGAEPLSLHRSGSFGPVIWVGVEHGPWLADLAHGLQRSLHVADRRFRAHVTVGRARGADGPARARDVAASLAAHDGPAWTPSGITLVESVTGPAPEYHVLARWPLRRPAADPSTVPSNRDTTSGAVPDSGIPTLEEP
jgi:RNA 2',3'-cyclic 3'-phosphodiesterase